jgi:hypothetical protein
MTPRALILGLAALATTTFAGDKYLVYYGTYTGAKTGSKGIYASTFDAATGTLGKPELAGETGSPSFVAIHPSKKYLYSVGEMSIPGEKGGGVTAFSDLSADRCAHEDQSTLFRHGRSLPHQFGQDRQDGDGGQLRRRLHGIVSDHGNGLSVGPRESSPAHRLQCGSEAPKRAPCALGEPQPGQSVRICLRPRH